MIGFLEFLACLFLVWIAYRFLRMAVADGVRDALKEIAEDDHS